MKRLLRNLTLAIACSGLALWAGVACDSATPTAPAGTILTISASPGQISLTGTSQITVVGRRPDGNPLNEGTEIFFSTSLGELTQVVTTVDEDGIARTTLRGDGRVGTATVTARVTGATGGEEGAGTGAASIDVEVGNPTVPSGTTLSIAAGDSQIDITGSTTITVIARRPDGNALTNTEVFFTTNLGSVSPAAAVTDSAGEAETTLRGEGRVGTATVEARVNTVGGGEGGGTATAMIDIQIGSTVSAVSLQATPTVVPEQFDGTSRNIQLLALVRDDQGQPLPGTAVNFSTQVGSLDSGGSFIATNAAGEARDTLRVTEGDLNTIAGNSFTVTVEAASGEGGVQTDSVDVAILRLPEANFDAVVNRRTVSFMDTSTGDPTSWEWDFDFQNNNFTVDSTARNPTFTYSMDGDFTVALRVRNSVGTDQTSRVVVIDTSN